MDRKSQVCSVSRRLLMVEAGVSGSYHFPQSDRTLSDLSLHAPEAEWVPPIGEGPLLFVVCGLHRSGTSFLSTCLANSGAMMMLDDPLIVINRPHGIRDVLSELALTAAAPLVVKAPRAAETACDWGLSKRACLVGIIRQPLDVFASICEAQLSTDPTTPSMLHYHDEVIERIPNPIVRFCAAYCHYTSQLCSAAQITDAKCSIVLYEDLVQDPGSCLERIANMSGLELDVDISVPSNRVDPIHNKPKGDTKPNGIGFGEVALDPEVTAIIKSACEDAYLAAKRRFGLS